MQTLSQFQEAFHTYLHSTTFSKNPEGLYDPMDYILRLGGKRLRPIVVLMAYDFFKQDWKDALPLALAIEVFHNFTLVHDDIMDDAPLRRGKPTVHEKWDLNTGILSGDVMLIKSYELLMQSPNPAALSEILTIFNQTAVEVCEGQQYDIDFETRDNVTIPEYIRMIELKTSVLFGGAMKIGALAADASDADAHHLYEFGKNIGIAFQLQDDILDTFGDPEKFGKKVGGDIIQNKKTFLVLKSLEQGSAAQQARMHTLLNTPTTDEVAKVNEVRELYNSLDIRGLANEEMQKYKTLAINHLMQVNAPEKKKLAFKELADYLIGREV